MRCKNCPYTDFDYSENVELCKLFGYGDNEISENRKHEEGCKFNMKTLDKKFKQYMEMLTAHPV